MKAQTSTGRTDRNDCVGQSLFRPTRAFRTCENVVQHSNVELLVCHVLERDFQWSRYSVGDYFRHRPQLAFADARGVEQQARPVHMHVAQVLVGGAAQPKPNA